MCCTLEIERAPASLGRETVKTVGKVAIIIFTVVSWAAADNSSLVERGGTVSVIMHLSSSIQLGNAMLSWQTYDDTAVKQARDHGMVLVFSCSGRFDQTAGIFTIPCTIPSNVADGHYYLTSVTLGDTPQQQTFSWRGGLPDELVIDVKGGPSSEQPRMTTIQVTATPQR